MPEKTYKRLFYFTLGVLIIQRFFHLGKHIENPHSWRQLDTVFYAYNYFKHGINLFKPSVAWLGSYKTLILELPLISAIMSFTYYLPGNEVTYMRLIAFLFFLGSSYFLYKIVFHFYYQRLAAIFLLIYLMLPLSLYYSRAVHIDFAVIFFTASALYYYIKGYTDENIRYIIIASVLSVFAYLIKVPYAFYIFFPLAYLIIKTKRMRFFIKTLPLIIYPLVLFVLWQKYVVEANASAPDWYFIPDYFKFDSMSSWYFGNLSQRFDLNAWERIITRSFANLTTFAGGLLFIAGIFINLKETSDSFFRYYLAGLIIYLLIFFNLNVIHDYYQIPFIVITAFYIAVTFEFSLKKFVDNNKKRYLKYILFIFLVLIVNSIWFTERWYYKKDVLRIEAAEVIMKETPENSLVIASITDTDPRDPRLLAPAYRYGWAIRLGELTPVLIDSLKVYGAEYLAIVTNDTLKTELKQHLGLYPSREHRIFKDNWKIILYKLEL